MSKPGGGPLTQKQRRVREREGVFEREGKRGAKDQMVKDKEREKRRNGEREIDVGGRDRKKTDREKPKQISSEIILR